MACQHLAVGPDFQIARVSDAFDRENEPVVIGPVVAIDGKATRERRHRIDRRDARSREYLAHVDDARHECTARDASGQLCTYCAVTSGSAGR